MAFKRKSSRRRRKPVVKQKRRLKDTGSIDYSAYTVSELRDYAKSLGIPYGGLRRTQLINKIKRYS